MSKYQEQGAYHYRHYAQPRKDYRRHVDDLLAIIRKHVPAGGSVLEAGAGEGLIVDHLRRAGFHASGFDSDKTAVQLAIDRSNPVELRRIEDTDTFSGYWDAILFADVLEHVHEPWTVLRRAREATRTIVIAAPSTDDPHAISETPPAKLKKWLGAHRLLHESTRHARHVLVASLTARVTKVTELDDVEVVEEGQAMIFDKVLSRVTELEGTQDGWLDGQGTGLDGRSDVAWIRDVLLLTISELGLQKPGIFLTPDGQVQAEWLEGDRQITIRSWNLPDARQITIRFDIDERTVRVELFDGASESEEASDFKRSEGDSIVEFLREHLGEGAE